MEIHPRYDAPPIVTLEPDGPIIEPTVRQRRRLVETLGQLTEAQWTAQSRCADWSVRDVASHLVVTNQFWSLSIAGALAGEPTRYLIGFDPKRSPAASAAADPSSPSEVLAALATSTESLCTTVEALSPDQLALTGEAPPGHVAVSDVLHHALWDCWIHERDVLLPLGLEPPQEADEVRACLRYVAALAPALSLQTEPERTGRLAIRAGDPETAFVLDVGGGRVAVRDVDPADGDVVLSGTAPELVDALSVRAPVDAAIPETHAWLVGGLAEVFEET